MKLVGWTHHEFKSPFDIHTIDDVRLLLDALQSGSCHWKRMTKGEVNRHKKDLEKRRAEGETIGKPRQPRSDIGTKRPQKKAPGMGEEDDDDALPAKKQKKRTSKKGDEINALPAMKKRRGRPRKLPRSPRDPSFLQPAPPAMSSLSVMTKKSSFQPPLAPSLQQWIIYHLP